MSPGHPTRASSVPPLTVSGVGPPRTVTGREAALVLALLDALDRVRLEGDSVIQLAYWGDHVATPIVLRRARRGS